MFCSNCGKTLRGDAATCPHCRAAVGDSRFDGHEYTGAQIRTRPGEAVRLPGNHTKTTFMGSDPTMSGDVDSRTTYRAVMGAKVSSYQKKEEKRRLRRVKKRKRLPLKEKMRPLPKSRRAKRENKSIRQY